MLVSSTELQNNFGRYLMLAAREDIIITRNGIVVAKLSSLSDAAPAGSAVSVGEEAPASRYGGRRASYGEFLELTEEAQDRYEYIDGEVYLLASPRTSHQVVLTRLFGIFFNWFHGKQCIPLVAPHDITLRRSPQDINVVQPDMMVICDLGDELDENGHYQGIPDLVTEIVSEGTRTMDLVKKFDLYMSCGVREYWIVNPINREVTVYHFAERDIREHLTYRASETAKSFIFAGLQVPLTAIFF